MKIAICDDEVAVSEVTKSLFYSNGQFTSRFHFLSTAMKMEMP